MSQRIINLGTGAGSGDGDELRNAFNKVNQNFAELYTAINAASSPVLNVAGRTGNVVLTINDVVGAVGTGYVDQKVLANTVAPPQNSKGKVGDTRGMLASDGAFFYFCYNNYDGVSNIWAKVPTVGTTW